MHNDTQQKVDECVDPKKDLKILGEEFADDDEPVCEHCGGTGEVTVDERVYANEPYTAPIGTQKCVCQIKEPEDFQE